MASAIKCHSDMFYGNDTTHGDIVLLIMNIVANETSQLSG